MHILLIVVLMHITTNATMHITTNAMHILMHITSNVHTNAYNY